MQNKLNVEQFHDLDPVEQLPVRRISRTMGYQNSESIQEEDEEYSSQSKNVIILAGPLNQFSMTCPDQPKNNVGSDVKVPTINSIYSKKSLYHTYKNADSNNLVEVSQLEIERKDSYRESVYDSSIKLNSFFRKKEKSPTINQQNVKDKIKQFINKLQKHPNLTLFQDITLIDQQNSLNPLFYLIITQGTYYLMTICTILSILFIPIRIIFTHEINNSFLYFSYIVHIIVLLQILIDIALKRGPIQIQEGVIIQKYKHQYHLYLDIPRCIILLLLFGFSDHFTNLFLIFIMIITQLLRQFQPQINVYYSTQLIGKIVTIWIAQIIYFTCLYSYVLDNYDLFQYLCISISILTHNSIDLQIETQAQSIIVSIYMLIALFSLLYTFSILTMWLKPSQKKEIEKEKLLSSFCKGASRKKIEYILKCKCYSYLEFILNEDLNKLQDALVKKLSPELQEELQVSVREHMIPNIKLFHRFSSSFKKDLIYWFDSQQFNPEDNIIQEQQIDDCCLYYVLKGKVKIQFQGYYQGKPKRTFMTLQQGAIFGEFSFITGIPPYISVNSCGLTTILKIRRSDFIELIQKYPKDNELYHLMRDSSNQNANIFECYYCNQRGHLLFQCQYLRYFPNRDTIIEKLIYPNKQQRTEYHRRIKGSHSWNKCFISLVVERAKQYQQKLSQELVTSEDFPPSSQLPYSENQTQQSASYLSRQSLQKYSPEQQSIVDSQEEQDYLLQEDIMSIEMNQNLRKQQNKTTLRTAGFPFIQESLGGGRFKHNTILDNTLNKEKLTLNTVNTVNNDVGTLSRKNLDTLNSRDKIEDTMKVSRRSNSSQNPAFIKKPTYNGARSMHAKLTFRYQQQQSSNNEDSLQYQQQMSSKQSIRQQSNRSNTYSNPLSNNLSNNPSSNSRNKSPNLSPGTYQQIQQQQQQQQQKYQQQASNKKQDQETIQPKNSSSDKSISDEQRNTNRKRSTKTGTKVSILGQQSQFQVFNTQEQHQYFSNEIKNFEKMFLFKRYNTHNNYDVVIQRLNNFQRSRKKKPCNYSIKSYVKTKIRNAKLYMEI